MSDPAARIRAKRRARLAEPASHRPQAVRSFTEVLHGHGEGSEQDRRDGILLTGATGFLGMELLVRYLRRSDRPIYALIRAGSDEEAAERLESALVCMLGPDHQLAGRVIAVRGDIARSGLGIREGYQALAERIDEIMHCAASVSFGMKLPVARAINVEGTARMLELAHAAAAGGAGLRRFSYVSTAYVAGEHRGVFNEDDLDVGQSFRNSYERSKFEAETLLRLHRAELPLTVLRPSIIVGESDSGWTSSFNVIYWPLRAFAHGSYAALPARADAPVDIVPVDYVADAAYQLSQSREAEGACFHLTAGARAGTIGELSELAASFFSRRPPHLVDPTLYRRILHPLIMRATPDKRLRRALMRSEIFFPYFRTQVDFDMRRARVALRETGIEPPRIATYFDQIAQFALDAEWGRHPISRALAAGLQGTAWGKDEEFAAQPPAAERQLVLVR